MSRFNTLLLILPAFLTLSTQLHAQELEETKEVSRNLKVKGSEILGIGLSYDYLKAHTFLLDDRDKWEFAVNLDIYDKLSIVTSYGSASLRPKDAYKNADYKSEGEYYRLGLDYIMYINPDNLFYIGLRYSQSKYDETINYQSENPLFEPQGGNIARYDLSANWMELVITSEKKIKKIFKQNLNDLFRIGFKARVKSNLNYTSFEFANTKQIPGYGLTNTKINPEINLYIKVRLGINRKKPI